MMESEFTKGYKAGAKYAATPRRGFMCRTDFEHEIGEAPDTSVYSSPEETLRRHPPAVECGIVEVEIRLVRVVDWGNEP